MKIDDEDLYYGAAIIQVAEHESFKAINRLPHRGLSHVYRINADVGLHLKYARVPLATGAYQFNFTNEHLEALEKLNGKVRRLFVGLVCARDREVACLHYVTLDSLRNARREAEIRPHATFTVLVKVFPGMRLRVYVSLPDRRGWRLGEQLIPRNNFPERLFA